MRTLWMACALLASACWVSTVVAEVPADAPAQEERDAGEAPRSEFTGGAPPREVEAVRKQIFLPAVADEPDPPAVETRVDTGAGLQVPPPVAAPQGAPAERPEDFMFLTGIVMVDGEKQALVENRRTNQAAFLKVGDPLGEGLIAEINTYQIVLREWSVNREVPLGYTVSGKKDTYLPPPPPNLTLLGASPNNSSPHPGAALPQRPPPEVWKQWTPEQKQEFYRRSEEARRRAQEEEERRRRAQEEEDRRRAAQPARTDAGAPRWPGSEEWSRWTPQQREEFTRRSREARRRQPQDQPRSQ